jgi:hypothetical protein
MEGQEVLSVLPVIIIEPTLPPLMTYGCNFMGVLKCTYKEV